MDARYRIRCGEGVIRTPGRIEGGEVSEPACARGRQQPTQFRIEGGLTRFAEPGARRRTRYAGLLYQYRAAGERHESREHIPYEFGGRAVGDVAKPRLEDRVHVDEDEVELSEQWRRRGLVEDVEWLGGCKRHAGLPRAQPCDQRPQRRRVSAAGEQPLVAE